MMPWTSQSSRAKQTALAAGCLAVGAVIMVALRGSMDPGTDAFAAFLLGVLLAVLGVAGLLVSGKQTTVVDPMRRRITIEDASWLRTKTRTIPFAEIAGISIGYLGKKSNFVSSYHLVLKLRSGEEYALFGPGRFYPGASSRPTVEGWRRRLEGYMATQEA